MAPLRLQGENSVFANPPPLTGISGTNLSNASDAGKGGNPDPIVLDRGIMSQSVPTTALNATVSGLQVLRYPLDTPMYYMTIGVHDYHRASWRSVGELNIVAAINLALPDSIIDNMNVTYDPEPLGAIGLGWEAIGGGLDRTKSITQQLATLTAAGTAAAAEKALGSLLGKQGLNAVLAANGLALNNFLTVMLKGPAYKKRTFQWRFSPRSADESEQLRQIQNLINNSGSPGLPKGIGSAFFNWPRIFKIQFRYQTGIDVGQYTFRMKPMVLTNAAWNYTPAGQPAFFGSTRAPEGIQVMLEFLELEYWLQGDYGVTANGINPVNGLQLSDPNFGA